MSWTQNYTPAPATTGFTPALPPEALAGVRTRRVIALCFDAIFIGVLSVLIFLLLGLATFGFAWFILPPILPIVAFFYNGFTISSSAMGTWGMRMMDLEVRTVEGYRPSFLLAALQAIGYWLTLYVFAPLLLWSLFSTDKRCLHDIFSGLVVVRRPR